MPSPQDLSDAVFRMSHARPPERQGRPQPVHATSLERPMARDYFGALVAASLSALVVTQLGLLVWAIAL